MAACRSRVSAFTRAIIVAEDQKLAEPLGAGDNFWRELVLHETSGDCSGRKICLFAHFDADAVIREDVVFYLKALKSEGFDTVFVTTSEHMEPGELRKLDEVVCKCIVRKNVGYDFGSWRTGFQYLDEHRVLELVVLANDSVIGPVNPIGRMFERMSETTFDIWGVTDNYEINYHVQSYFLCFTRPAIERGFLRMYMDEIQVEPSKQDIINKYEVGLSQKAIHLGYRLGAYCMYDDLESEILKGQHDLRHVAVDARVNSTLWFVYDLLSAHGAPFIKKELLVHNPHSIDLSGCIEYIRHRSDYPYELLNVYIQ